MKIYERNMKVCEIGETGDEFYIILSGEVEVYKGGRALTKLGPGVHFGEMALVDHSPRSATVQAVEPTRLMSLTRSAFYSLVRTEPVLASKLLWSFVQVLSHRLRATNEALSGGEAQAAPFAQVEVARRDLDRGSDRPPRLPRSGRPKNGDDPSKA